MSRIIALLIAAMLINTAALAKSTEFSFLGIGAGDNIETVKQKLDLAEQKGNIVSHPRSASSQCKEGGCFINGLKLGDLMLQYVTITIIDGDVISIGAGVMPVRSASFLDALIGKYGKADKVNTFDMQNGYGAKFKDKLYEWHFKDGKMIFTSSGNPANRNGDLMEFTTKKHSDKFKNQKKAKDAM